MVSGDAASQRGTRFGRIVAGTDVPEAQDFATSHAASKLASYFGGDVPGMTVVTLGLEPVGVEPRAHEVRSGNVAEIVAAFGVGVLR